MDDIKEYLKIKERKVRNYRFNKIEWINYFNNELKIESISNHINDNSNIKIENNNNLLTKKNNNIVQRHKRNNKNIFIYEEETIDFHKYNNLNLFKNRNKNTKFKNINNKSKRNEKKYKGSIEKSQKKVNNNEYLEKIMDNSRKNSNRKKIFQKNKYNNEYSYANRFRFKRNLKAITCHFPSKEKTITSNDDILFERTLPQMYVLNNYGLVNDEEYELYKKIYNMKY